MKNHIRILVLLTSFLAVNTAIAQTTTNTNKAGTTTIKKCEPGCIKACCAKGEGNPTKKSACALGCIKSCCAKTGEQNEKQPCPPGCTKSCCVKEDGKT